MERSESKVNIGTLVHVFSLTQRTYLPSVYLVRNVISVEDKLKLYHHYKYEVMDIYSGEILKDINVWGHFDGFEYQVTECDYDWCVRLYAIFQTVRHYLCS